MTDPWTVLGWIIVGVIATVFVFLAIFFVLLAWKQYAKPWLYRMWRHYRTRSVLPAAGQLWNFGKDSGVYVNRLFPNGRIGIRAGAMSWSDSPEEWLERVRRCRAYLVDP